MGVGRTFTRGARQLVVHEALDTMLSTLGSYSFSFTPITNMGASAEGAEMMTFLAPPFRWAFACKYPTTSQYENIESDLQ